MRKQNPISFQTIVLTLIVVLFTTCAFTPKPVAATTDETDATDVVSKGIAYLGTQINEDGGVRWFDESSSAAATIRVVQALASAGYEQDFLQSDSGISPIDYLETAGADWVNQQDTEEPAFNVARAGQLLTAIAAANLDPQHFGDNAANLVYPLVASYDSSTGSYGESTPESVTDQVWAMIGLAANAFSIPSEAVTWLVNAQLEDGSWDDGYGSYLDTTPLAIIALIASDEMTSDSTAIQSAVHFLAANQQADGGWQSSWDTMTNANTTGVILQAISALGQSSTDETWQQADGNPTTALIAIQQESGVIGDSYANAYSTGDAIVGLSGQTVLDLGYLYKADLSFDYIFSQQAANGGWGTVGQTLDIILALQAAGWDPATVTVNEVSPLDYLAENLTAYIENGPDAIGKAILGVSAAELDPNAFSDIDLVAALNATYDETTGAFCSAENTWHQALAILGLKAAGESIPVDVVDTLKGLQQEDGGWEYSAGFGSWPDSAALAIQALVAAGESTDSTAIQNGLAYLQNMQTETGGWGDSSTTAYAIMAANALDIPNSDWENETGLTPLSELFTFQKVNGAFVYNWEYSDDSLMSTASALLALFGEDLTLSPTATDLAYAGLVIDPGEEEATTLCVPIDSESIDGFDLLEASGVSYDAPEGFIESIMEISNADGETNYWSYWQWNGNAWTFASSGAGDSVVQAGTIEAWHFTSWEIFPSLAPDVVPNLSTMCETSVLKNYAEQPNLSYSDLFSVDLAELAVEESVETVAAVEETVEPTEEFEPTEAPAVEEASEEEKSLLPLYIIAGAVVIVVVVIAFILKKKDK